MLGASFLTHVDNRDTMRALRSASMYKASSLEHKTSNVWLSRRYVCWFGPLPPLSLTVPTPKAAERMSSGADPDAPTSLSMEEMMEIWTHPELVDMRTEVRQVCEPPQTKQPY